MQTLFSNVISPFAGWTSTSSHTDAGRDLVGMMARGTFRRPVAKPVGTCGPLGESPIDCPSCRA